MYSLFTELTESKLFPSIKSIEKQDAEQLSELCQLHMCAIRILLSESITRDWAIKYCKKTTQNDLKKWHQNDTDLAIMFYALTSETEIKNSKFRDNLPIDISLISIWLKAAAKDNEQETVTKRVFTRLDTMLKIRNESLKAIRRLVLEWPDLDREEKKLSITRMLQFMRTRALRGEVLPELEKLAHYRSYEMHDVCNPETGKGCDDSDDMRVHGAPKRKKFGMIPSLVGGIAGYALGRAFESATAGATSSANVAVTPTVLGGIGPGFDSKGDKGVYSKKKQLLLRRPSIFEGTEKITVSGYGMEDKEVRIFINPVQSVLRNIKQNSIRGLIINGDLYVWDAILATHHQVINAYGIDEDARFEITKENNSFVIHYHKSDFNSPEDAENFFYSSPNLLKSLVDFEIKDDLFV